MTGRKESCWARLKRWISSTNSSVPCPCARRARAASKIFFSSATPVWIAETCTNARRGSRRSAARPSSCRCRAAPRRSSSRASARRAAASARRPGRSDAPGRRPRRCLRAQPLGERRGGGSGFELEPSRRLMTRLSRASAPLSSAAGRPLAPAREVAHSPRIALNPGSRLHESYALSYAPAKRWALFREGSSGSRPSWSASVEAKAPGVSMLIARTARSPTGIRRRVAPGRPGDDAATRSSASIR